MDDYDDRPYICSDGQVRLGMERPPAGVTALRPLDDGESKAAAQAWLAAERAHHQGHDPRPAIRRPREPQAPPLELAGPATRRPDHVGPVAVEAHPPGRRPEHPADSPLGWDPGSWYATPGQCPVDHARLLDQADPSQGQVQCGACGAVVGWDSPADRSTVERQLPPPRVESQRARRERELLTDPEFAVLDILAEADARFMGLPQAEDAADHRAVWRAHLVALEGLVMRRAAIRAYPRRFVADV